jgi:predicted NUDIX family phosphoesterase
MAKTDLILAIRATHVQNVLDGRTGYIPIQDIDLGGLFRNEEMCIKSRKYLDAKENPEDDYIQVISVCTVISGDYNDRSIAVYPRTGTEEKLHGLQSVGFGGHVDNHDVYIGDGLFAAKMHEGHLAPFSKCINGYKTLGHSTGREMQEEVQFRVEKDATVTIPQATLNGVIYSEASPVDKLHIGFHHIVYMPAGVTIHPARHYDVDGRLVPVEIKRIDMVPLSGFNADGTFAEDGQFSECEMETWGKIIISHLKR